MRMVCHLCEFVCDAFVSKIDKDDKFMNLKVQKLIQLLYYIKMIFSAKRFIACITPKEFFIIWACPMSLLVENKDKETMAISF